MGNTGNTSLDCLSDRELLAETARVVDCDRQTTARLLGLLAEVDVRKLYLGQSCSSLFTYCTQVLHLSEPAAYSRITAARVARRFPVILSLVAAGAVTLTTVSLLAAHLTDENHEALLEAARHKSKRDVERLVAALHPQPDIASSVRKLPSTSHCDAAIARLVDVPDPARPSALDVPRSAQASVLSQPLELSPRTPSRRTLVAPLTPQRYLIRITVSRETHDKLERARSLLRHAIPSGDPAAIVDRALTLLVEQLERTKHAATSRPRSKMSKTPTSRHVPAAVKRAVWARDEGRCAFVGARGRCAETGFLEYHHVVPFAAGGVTALENLQLRCRSHNAYEAECQSGGWWARDSFGGSGRRQLCPDRVDRRTLNVAARKPLEFASERAVLE
jgi:hypothetical protein